MSQKNVLCSLEATILVKRSKRLKSNILESSVWRRVKFSEKDLVSEKFILRKNFGEFRKLLKIIYNDVSW